jgi:hypothetical protein
MRTELEHPQHLRLQPEFFALGFDTIEKSETDLSNFDATFPAVSHSSFAISKTAARTALSHHIFESRGLTLRKQFSIK